MSSAFVCRKLIVKSKQTESDFCSEECRLVNKNEWTKEVRKRNSKSNVQRIYDIFHTTGNNLKRKLKKDEAILTKFDEFFKEMRKKALALKNSVTDHSPDTELSEYRKQILQMTDDIQRYADTLNEEIMDKKYKRK